MHAVINLIEKLTEGMHWDDATNEFLFTIGVIGIQKWCGGQLQSKTIVTQERSEDGTRLPVREISLTGDIAYLLFLKQDTSEFPSDDVTRLLRGLYILSQNLKRLKTDAIHDPLTGLLNRRGLDEWFQQRTKGCEHGSGFVLVYMDLDDFKAVNDTMGHAKGDEALIHVTNDLLRTLRSTDVITRVGGDEFVFIIDHMLCHPDYKQRLQGIVRSLSLTTYGISATFGAVCYPAHGALLGEFMEKADRSLYEGKAIGRNCIRFWEDIQ